MLWTIVNALRAFDHWCEECNSAWSTPYPDMVAQAITWFKSKFKIIIYPYCQSNAQRRKGMLIIIAAIILIKKAWGKEFGPIQVINDIPYWEFSDFLRDSEGIHRVTAFLLYTVGCAGLSVFIISLIQMFIIGKKKANPMFADRICAWFMNAYICGLCADICRCVALFYSREKSLTGNLMVEFLEMLAGAFILIIFSECMKDIFAFYLSRPVFILFCALKLHYIALFIMQEINRITHMELFKNTTDILCLLVVIFLQQLLKFLEFTGIYGVVMKWVKGLLTFRTMVMFSLITMPFVVLAIIIIKFYILLQRLFVG